MTSGIYQTEDFSKTIPGLNIHIYAPPAILVISSAPFPVPSFTFCSTILNLTDRVVNLRPYPATVYAADRTDYRAKDRRCR